MQRFYFDMDLGDMIEIGDKDFFHQISHVLRSRIGDEVVVFNGDSHEYSYEIQGINKKSIVLKLTRKEKNMCDPEMKITIYQAIPNKFEKIDYIIQKGVEIGISDFVFWKSERSSKLIISENKMQRFLNIAKESLEQCGGNRFPKISVIEKLDLKRIEGDTIFCDTKKAEDGGLRIESQRLSILIGPEGGFSDKEIEEFGKAGFWGVNFGNRILRTETMSSVLAFKILNS